MKSGVRAIMATLQVQFRLRYPAGRRHIRLLEQLRDILAQGRDFYLQELSFRFDRKYEMRLNFAMSGVWREELGMRKVGFDAAAVY